MSLPRLTALLAALLLAGGPPLGWAAELFGPAQVVPVSPNSVTVRWRTDVPTGSRVGYGLAAEAADQHAEGALTDAHEVALTGLQPGTRYFFHVGTARKKLGSGEFTTSGSAASAHAAASTSPVAKTSTAPGPAKLAAAKAPPTRETWGSLASLPDHFARHGADFSAKNADDYARLAWEFRERAKAERLPTKLDETGVKRVFDPKTGAFAAYNRDGTTKTFFKPGSPGYFERQPGRIVAP